MPLRSVVIDLRGFGKSNTIKALNSFEEFAEDVHSIVVHIMKTPKEVRSEYTLAGWGMGATVALMMSLQYPQLYQRMILISPMPISNHLFSVSNSEGNKVYIKFETQE